MQAEIFRKEESFFFFRMGIHDDGIPRGMYILDIKNNIFKTTVQCDGKKIGYLK